MKVGAENKKQLKVMIALLAISALIAIYNFKDTIWGSSAAAPSASATAQPNNAAGGLPVQDSSDPRLRTDILDSSRKVKYEAGNRNPFAMGQIVIPPMEGSAKLGPTPTPLPPTPTPPPKIPIKYYGLVSKPGEPKKIFLQPEGKEQVYIAVQGDIIDRRYRVVQIQPTSVVMEDVLTGNRQPIQVEPLQLGGR